MKRSLPEVVAIARFKYHANMLDIVNVANQLHILSDEKAEEMNKHHAMTIMTDLLPRLTGLTVDDILKRKDWERTLSFFSQ